MSWSSMPWVALPYSVRRRRAAVGGLRSYRSDVTPSSDLRIRLTSFSTATAIALAIFGLIAALLIGPRYVTFTLVPLTLLIAAWSASILIHERSVKTSRGQVS